MYIDYLLGWLLGAGNAAQLTEHVQLLGLSCTDLTKPGVLAHCKEEEEFKATQQYTEF